MVSYIYLLQEREFIKTNEPIYKIGKTKQINDKRFKQYPKGSILLLQKYCENCDEKEKELIKIFKNNFIQRKDIGTEYFEGKYEDMMLVIENLLNQQITNNKHNNSNYSESNNIYESQKSYQKTRRRIVLYF